MADRAKLEKIANALDFKKEYEQNPGAKTFKEIERVDFAIDEQAKLIEEVQDGAMQIVEAVNKLDQTKADKEDVAQQIESIARIPGRPGNQGPVGPVGPKGDKGDKGDTVIVDKIIERVETIKEQPIVKTEIVKETTVKEDISGEELVKRVNKLEITPDKQIDATHIKNLPKAMAGHYPVGVSETRVKALIAENPAGASAFTDLTDTFSSYTGLGGQGLRVNATEDGIDTYTAVDTDEKVKLSAADPTAGYLNDKITSYQYNLDFVTGDWVLNGANYELEVEHSLDVDNPKVSVLMSGSQVSPNSVSVSDSNTILLSVPATPDLRFAGKVSVSSI